MFGLIYLHVPSNMSICSAPTFLNSFPFLANRITTSRYPTPPSTKPPSKLFQTTKIQHKKHPPNKDNLNPKTTHQKNHPPTTKQHIFPTKKKHQQKDGFFTQLKPSKNGFFTISSPPNPPQKKGNISTSNHPFTKPSSVIPTGPDKATSDMQLGEGGQGPNLAIGENLHEDEKQNRGDVGEDVGNGFGNVGSWKISSSTKILGIFFWVVWCGWKDEGSLQDRSGLVLDLEFVCFLFVFFWGGRRLRNVKYLHDRMFDTDKCCFILGKMNEIWNIFEWHMSYVSW